jgi:lipopolysaccharide export LptBFGC system permease protein LptF
LQQVTGVAALYSKAPLWLIMWLPNIIYAVLAVFLLKMAPK